jgi:hypothetical protein
VRFTIIRLATGAVLLLLAAPLAAEAQGAERVSFHFSPRSVKECPNWDTQRDDT